MPKASKARKASSYHHDPLAIQMDADYQERVTMEKKEAKRKRKQAFKSGYKISSKLENESDGIGNGKQSIDDFESANLESDEDEVEREENQSKVQKISRRQQKQDKRLSEKILQQAAQQLREAEMEETRNYLEQTRQKVRGDSSSSQNHKHTNLTSLRNRKGLLKNDANHGTRNGEDDDNETDGSEEIDGEEDIEEVENIHFDPIEEDEFIGIRDGAVFSKDVLST